MNSARNLIGDTRLITFFNVAKGMRLDGAGRYPEGICAMIEDGQTLDEIFDPDKPGGKLTISAKAKDDDTFDITLGYYMGPTAGNGVFWNVEFDGDEIRAIRIKGRYVS